MGRPAARVGAGSRRWPARPLHVLNRAHHETTAGADRDRSLARLSRSVSDPARLQSRGRIANSEPGLSLGSETDSISESELHEVRLTTLHRPHGKRRPQMIREPEARAVALVEPRHVLILHAAPLRVAELKEHAQPRHD